MVKSNAVEEINSEIKLLGIKKELIDSKNWDDKTHLERKYKMHESSFYSSISELCISLGLFDRTYPNEDGVYSVKMQSGEKRNFDISRDYNNQKGKDKLISYIDLNEKTNERVLMFYSPTQGINFEYSADLLPKNIQLGKNDFFGKNIESLIKNVSSATEDIKFETNVNRFKQAPFGLKDFYIITKGFISREKAGDVRSIITFFDGVVQGLHKNAYCGFYGENFFHEGEKPLFNFGIKASLSYNYIDLSEVKQKKIIAEKTK